MPVQAANSVGIVFNIQEYSIQDGEGIRTTVFLKGCPLRCLWCSNPEGQHFRPELMHSRSRCARCLQCKSVCPHSRARVSADGFPVFPGEECRACGEKSCVEMCIKGALRKVGEHWSAKALWERVRTSSLFFKNSGGGVTLSGGEPLAQPEFVRDFLRLCQDSGLSIVIETCGSFEWNRVKEFIDEFDFYYFDIKSLDAKRHSVYTGHENHVILRNLERLASRNAPRMTGTITIIPGFNAFENEVLEMARFARKAGVSRIRLLPFHSFGESKYEDLGRSNPFFAESPPTFASLQGFQRLIQAEGVECWIE